MVKTKLEQQLEKAYKKHDQTMEKIIDHFFRTVFEINLMEFYFDAIEISGFQDLQLNIHFYRIINKKLVLIDETYENSNKMNEIRDLIREFIGYYTIYNENFIEDFDSNEAYKELTIKNEFIRTSDVFYFMKKRNFIYTLSGINFIKA